MSCLIKNGGKQLQAFLLVMAEVRVTSRFYLINIYAEKDKTRWSHQRLKAFHSCRCAELGCRDVKQCYKYTRHPSVVKVR